MLSWCLHADNLEAWPERHLDTDYPWYGRCLPTSKIQATANMHSDSGLSSSLSAPTPVSSFIFLFLVNKFTRFLVHMIRLIYYYSNPTLLTLYTHIEFGMLLVLVFIYVYLLLFFYFGVWRKLRCETRIYSQSS